MNKLNFIETGGTIMNINSKQCIIGVSGFVCIGFVAYITKSANALWAVLLLGILFEVIKDRSKH
jgi:hypothetical protein